MKGKFRQSSIGARMLLVMGVVLLLQTGLITGSIIGSGAIERLSENSYDIFNQKIITRKNYLEYEMISRWSNLTEAEQKIEAHFSRVLEKNNAGFDEIETNSDLAVELLRNSAEDVIELLRRNSVTGAFLVLEGSPAVDDNGGTVKNGLYFRDMDPSSTSQDNSDILIERAPTAITKELGIPMDSEWHPVFLFSGENDQRNLFYQNPIRAAQSYPEAEPKELGYWSKPFYLDERSVPVITYSMPLRAPDGTVYGVLGVEITLDYLSKLLPYTELSEETNVSYVLAVRQPDSNQYVPVMSTGPLYTYLYSGGDGVLTAGEACYHKYSESYEQLIRYADFAMYSVKNMTKGRFAEFNITDYEKSAYLLHNSEELNRLIEEELLDYYFQPIVNARTGQVFGYEALMRPRLTSLETPLEVLSLAKSQGKLYQIERLTWFLALKSFTGFKNIPPDCRLFINSIANQGLSESDEKALEAQYGPCLGSLVVELTEEEERVESYTRKKISFLKRHGGQVALDDFGAGYNGEVSLLAVRPDFIKVDLSIVRNCHQDKNRQEMISNIISFARKNNSLVIAEGVQSREEMDTVISLGVDYLQGYYVGVPSLTSQPIPDKILKEITSRSR